MPSQVYNIPIIQPDLRREETIQQVADTLTYMEKVANDVFDRILGQVTENHTRLESINKRIDVAQAKVEKIKGSRKAIKVFSSAKYPAPDSHEAYKSVYDRESTLGQVQHPFRKLNSKHQNLDSRALREKLQFYNVQLNIRKDREGESSLEGLGGLPKHVESVNSLLLFNTSENPYKKYVMIDPLGAVTKTRKAIEEEQEEIGAAPMSITQREQMERQGMENYFYVPDLGDVPEIDVPNYLPDLPGIADDLTYSADLGPSIAPSLPGSHVPELPSVGLESGVIDALPSAPAHDLPALPAPEDSFTAAPPPGGVAPPPPPPPPPPPGIEGGMGGPPPPPPPPPPPGPPGTPADLPAPQDGRANLMESIRMAGGSGKAKLRDVKERKIEKKQKKQNQAVTGMSLMDDLASKLSMRRKGISGSRQTGGGGAGGGTEDFKVNSNSVSTMDKLSAMIPPPPKPSRSRSNTANSEDDWN